LQVCGAKLVGGSKLLPGVMGRTYLMVRGVKRKEIWMSKAAASPCLHVETVEPSKAQVFQRN